MSCRRRDLRRQPQAANRTGGTRHRLRPRGGPLARSHHRSGEVPCGHLRQEGAPKRAWQKLSAGAGAKGHRFYNWAVIDLADPRPGSRQLLIRRNRSTGELAYYRCYSPASVPLTVLVQVAGSRWRVEEFFQSGKGLAALDEHQVRRYTSWSRWVPSPCSRTPSSPSYAHTRPAPDALIPLTCNEIQRLFITLVVRPANDAAHRLGWSDWLRRHQARSQASHYRQQATQA